MPKDRLAAHDFYCPALALIVEVDGGYHAAHDQVLRDQERTVLLNLKGYRVLRFSNEEVLTNLESVLETIRNHSQPPPPA